MGLKPGNRSHRGRADSGPAREPAWFRILVRGRAKRTGLYFTCWARAREVGQAIALAEATVAKADLPEGQATYPSDVRAECADEVNFDDIGDDAYEHSDGLYVTTEINTWDIATNDGDFWFPEGVVPCTNTDGADADDIVEGYIVFDEDDGRATVEACVDRRNVLSTLRSALAICPKRMTIRVVLMDGSGEPEHEWRSPTPMSTVAFVNGHSMLVRHGLVFLSFRTEDCIVSLTDHKDIMVTKPSRKRCAPVTDALGSTGLPVLETYRGIGGGYRHYHYVPSSIAPMGQAELAIVLANTGLTRTNRDGS